MLSVAGFLLLFTHMSKVMYLLTYISYLSYAMDALAQSIYGYDRLPVPCPETEEFCLFSSPVELLREVGMEKPNFWNDIMFLGCNFIFLRLLAFCTLRRTLAKVWLMIKSYENLWWIRYCALNEWILSNHSLWKPISSIEVVVPTFNQKINIRCISLNLSCSYTYLLICFFFIVTNIAIVHYIQ